MIKCEKCGKKIKLIATRFGESVACEEELKIFLNENGRELKGYLIHKCKFREDEKNESR